ncbi:hypothetical protein GOV13_01345 [Candidatus Pacearchaeota archaeon]|nr:hypothetical protein [Candidatus Pacearchaeota archaeon]
MAKIITKQQIDQIIEFYDDEEAAKALMDKYADRLSKLPDTFFKDLLNARFKRVEHGTPIMFHYCRMS